MKVVCRLTFFLPFCLAFYLAWHLFWHFFCHSVWHILWYFILQSSRHFFGHSTWHSIWHMFRHCIWRPGPSSFRGITCEICPEIPHKFAEICICVRCWCCECSQCWLVGYQTAHLSGGQDSCSKATSGCTTTSENLDIEKNEKTQLKKASRQTSFRRQDSIIHVVVTG